MNPWLLAATTVLLWSSSSARQTYTIVAPRVLRPNLDYHVGISVHGTSQSTNVNVEVGGVQDSGGRILNSKTAVVSPDTTQMIKFTIGDLGPGNYNLSATGTGGLRFFNTTKLEYIHKSYSVFIQTDKAIYKPGQKVQFRVIVVNPQLRPSVTGAVDVFMSDGKGNRVQQWLRVFTTKGVFSGELQLSDQPVLGDWNITVKVLDQETSKSFLVAEYVLPKFEVSIDLPPYATFKDSKIVASVKAKYTYGKPVRGEVEVRAFPNIHSSYIQPVYYEPVIKTADLDGNADVKFSLVDELSLEDDYEREIQFEVVVTEALTGRKQNATGYLSLYKHRYKMELVRTAENYKPGLKYTAYLKVAYQDNTPVQDSVNMVAVKYGYSYNHEEYNQTKYPIPENGVITLDFYPPVDEDIHVLGIEADYLDLNQWFSTTNRALSPSNSYIQAIVQTEDPKVGSDVVVNVNSTTRLNHYVYEVLGRGDVVFAQTMQAFNQTSHSFTFLATADMAPKTRVVVYYVREDGEIVADAVDFDVEGTFQNTVDIELSTDSAEPGNTVDITVRTKPNSFVGVLGIDQSVLLLRSGNDITQEDVLNELDTYDSGKKPDIFPFFVDRRRRRKRSLLWWPGSATASQVFEDSGVVVLTNAYIHEHFPFVYYRADFVDTIHNNIAVPAKNMPMYLPAPLSVSAAGLGEGASSFTVRSSFVETWLWQDLSAGFDGTAKISKSAPDTITSWIVTAFSMDSLHGLGISDQPTKLQVFRPFFISLNLPYSVVREEAVAVQAVIFNYQRKSVDAEVTLESAGDFDFASFTNEVDSNEALVLYKKKKVSIKAGRGASVSFMIVPRKLGYIDIKMTARSSTAGDAVIRKLLVKPEGVPEYRNKAMLVDLRKTNSISQKISIDTPKNVINGSTNVGVSVIGDIMGSTVNNLDKLLRMPHGCGEQNMLNFVPNIVVTEYLQNTDQLTESINHKAQEFMRSGYMRELSYRREDGSFSAFGERDPSGSTWLTAFVARAFHQARDMITIDERVIVKALRWLADNQAPNGSFPEVGRVSHTPMQGGASKGVPLTAFTLLSFLETREGARYPNNINRAVDYLASNLPSDPYELAIVTYALHLADNPKKNQAFRELNSLAKVEGDLMWWSRPAEVPEKSVWYNKPRSVDVEMSAYALLTYVNRGLDVEALPIVKWLIGQRNNNGGFQSTQDTVIGITALARLAERFSSKDTNLQVRIIYGARGKAMSVNSGNSMILQKFELPSDTRQVEVSASGNGVAIVQVSYEYNVEVTGPDPAFFLNPQVDKVTTKNHLKVSICSGYEGKGERSNMAVMEVNLPSGYTVDKDAIPGLYKYKRVKRVDTQNGDTTVVIYFDNLDKYEVCPTVSAFRTFKVANQKPAAVTLYDYYDLSRQARQFYEAAPATLCDICEGSDCHPKKCDKATDPNRQRGSAMSVGASSSIALLLILVIML